MSGLCKLFGHPIVYVRDSAIAWSEKGMILKEGLEHMGIELSNMFKLEFCRNYYRDMVCALKTMKAGTNEHGLIDNHQTLTETQTTGNQQQEGNILSTFNYIIFTLNIMKSTFITK